MKSKYGLKLPWGIYISILALLALATIVWDKVESSDDKILINYLCAVFSLSTIQGAILIRMGKFDLYKNILNAIWNIETAIVFLYGSYAAIQFSNLPIDKQPSFTKWAFANLELFVLIISTFGAVCLARAGYSVAEVFKNPILEIASIEKNSTDKKPSQKNLPNKPIPNKGKGKGKIDDKLTYP